MAGLRATEEVPQISVVVIGRNEGERLSRCLESVQRMRWPGAFELIYVDSDSHDASPELAGKAGAQVIRLDTGMQTAARGRNAGWRRASASLVLFLDGDTVLDPDFPLRAVQAVEADAAVAVVWGHCREIHPSASIYNRVLDLDWIYAPGFSEFCGGNALIRRDVLESVAGFDESFIAGEEPEMCRRIRSRGYKILHIDAAMVGHDLAITGFRQYWRRAVRSGYAYANVASRFRDAGEEGWDREARRNLMRGAALALVSAAGVALSVASRSALPGLAAAGILATLIVRTACQVKWKSGRWSTRLLYGVHAHFQQIPMLAGQLQYRLDRRRGRTPQLIEYKEALP